MDGYAASAVGSIDMESGARYGWTSTRTMAFATVRQR
jgi:hypothetical protein